MSLNHARAGYGGRDQKHLGDKNIQHQLDPKSGQQEPKSQETLPNK
jgi:hypothetical protein